VNGAIFHPGQNGSRLSAIHGQYGSAMSYNQGNVVGEGNAYEQARYILQKIERYLHAAGAEMRHVVRTRIYATNADLWQDIGRAHHEYFKDVLPANTLVVAQLIGSAYLVEIEAEAIIHDES
jgi:enamine deaminase RidA (YjgF/YER057c/UK114 family)